MLEIIKDEPMKIEVKRMGYVTSRNMVNIPLRPDYLADTNIKPGDECYIAYGKDMIIMSKSIDIVNKLAQRDAALIIDRSNRRRGSR